ncbi:Eukaryotic porin/Tom40 [Artemisia annua]|uniref:Eukaryotic porin/Tom40 n=1 Tax=Artemisia annua TaxID=35608 RepID=A0A2U1QEB9_ARTAN|nr:Eukaryotic porin/Tom40 [Artemisia annua]
MPPSIIMDCHLYPFRHRRWTTRLSYHLDFQRPCPFTYHSCYPGLDLLYKDYQGYNKDNDDLLASIAVKPAPGLEAILSLGFPVLKSSKLEFQYLDEDGGICASVGLLANPIMRYSAVMGTKARSIGSDISFDTNTGSCTNYSVGFSFSKEDSIATLTLNDKGNGSGGMLSGSYYRSVKSLTNTYIGAEINLSFSTNESTFMVGAEHVWDPLTTVKARINSSGVASALIQHQLLPNIHFTLSGEADTKAPFNTATFDLVFEAQVVRPSDASPMVQADAPAPLFTVEARCIKRLSSPLLGLGQFIAMENKGPGIYSDLGKKARDLLYKDYQGYYKFKANAIISSGMKKG